MFFPRIAATDRLRGRIETFGNGGAVAGLLSRTGEAVSAVIAAKDPEPLLRAGARLSRDVQPADRWSLAAHGVNVLQAVRSADRERPPLRTLACGASASSDWSYLSQRRFALFVINSIERGTRWCVLRPGDPTVWERVAAQVRRFPGRVAKRRRVRGGAARSGVLRDLRRAHQRTRASRTWCNILVQFAATHAGEYHSFMVTHSVSGATVRPVVVNRLEASLLVAPELEQEFTIRIDPRDGSLLASH